MIVFWFIAGLLLLIALVFVLLPLWRAPRHEDLLANAKDTGVSIYQTQLEELEQDRKADLISEEYYQSARTDLQRNLLEINAHEKEASKVFEKPVSSWRKAAGMVSVVIIPILALWLYSMLGNASAIHQSQLAQPSMHELETVITALHERLENAPDNPGGWAMLARSYQVIGRETQALEAYARSLQHGGDANADILIDYADLLAASRDNGLTGAPMQLIEKALLLEPNHAKGLWLAGTEAFYGADYERALLHWDRLARILPPDSEGAQIIQANLDEIRTRIEQQAPTSTID